MQLRYLASVCVCFPSEALPLFPLSIPLHSASLGSNGRRKENHGQVDGKKAFLPSFRPLGTSKRSAIRSSFPFYSLSFLLSLYLTPVHYTQFICRHWVCYFRGCEIACSPLPRNSLSLCFSGLFLFPLPTNKQQRHRSKFLEPFALGNASIW